MTESKWNTKFSKLLVLAFLLILLPIVNATTFGYNYLDNQPSGNITNIYENNTYINQTLELNSTQFETGEPTTIKTSWLTSFIEGISKWVNYYTKTEIDNRYSNNTGDQSSSDFNLSDLNDVIDTSKATGKILQVNSDGNHEYVDLPDSNLSALVPYTGATQDVDLGENDFTVNTDTLYVDSAKGNIGIGTTNPNHALSIIGKIETGDKTKRYTIGKREGFDQLLFENAYTGSNAYTTMWTDNAGVGTNSKTQMGFALFNVDVDALGYGSLSYGGIVYTTSEITRMGGLGADSSDVQIMAGGNEAIRVKTNGNIGIGTITADEKLEVNGNIYLKDNDKSLYGTWKNASIYYDGTNLVFNTSESGSGLAYFSNNVSATGYITRTSIFDKSKGTALSYIKDASEYLNAKSDINHKSFYGYVEQKVTDFSRPVIDYLPKEVCSTDENEKEKCVIEYEVKTTYPYTKIEDGVDLGKEIDVLRQAVYELKQQNEFLQEQINNLTGKDTKIEEANTRQDKALCSIKLFDWCLIK